MAYKHPSQEIAQYLINEGDATLGRVYVDNIPLQSELQNDPDYILVVRMINGTPNPRFLRDDITIVMQVVCYKRDKITQARDYAWSVYNKLLGAYNIELNGYTYFQFTSQQMPNLVSIDSESSLYTSTLSFVREAQNKEGNRDIIS
ncbi:hypothetical protein [Haliea sp.]|uniref:hypothetical protein n=1 Tax=Haliea sp. TaxID=1932666 RepID=UPI0025C549F6|nr:hypothetical protein [Haliea sp.]|tara:strand:- start:4872 stop:5309 length:438 start_codon:yes stop_codon:yes gene_type:complete